MSDASTTPPTAAGSPGTQRKAQLHWDDSKMSTSFANVVNIQPTREQVDLFFGTNQTWNIQNDSNTLSIALSNRVTLSPHAARRLSIALVNVLRKFEGRHGPIQV